MRNLFLILMLVVGQYAIAEDSAKKPSLDEELKELNMPENMAPSAVSKDTLYSVQNRYNDLRNRFEVEVGGAHNFHSSSYLNSNQVDLTARFHINNRWNVSANYAYGFNQFTSDANDLFQKEQIIPSVSYVKSRAGVLLGFHPFYGKFRISMDQVLYFDNYIAIGPGLTKTQFDNNLTGIAQVGFVFWFGHNWSTRVGLDNQFYNEKSGDKSSLTYHALGHLSLGYIFGGGSNI